MLLALPRRPTSIHGAVFASSFVAEAQGHCADGTAGAGALMNDIAGVGPQQSAIWAGTDAIR